MKFEIKFERIYPQPPETVWRALTDPAALGEWLMETDFMPEVGRGFRLRCEDGEGGTDTYLCRLLEYEPPARMLWSWRLEGAPDEGEMLVELRVEPVAEGSKVTIVHSGDRDADTVEKFRGGWPVKLQDLAAVLLRTPDSK